MAETTGIIKKREELKYELENRRYQTTIDWLFEAVSRFIQTLTRSSRQPPLWYNLSITGLVVLLIYAAVSLALGEIDPRQRLFIPIATSSLILTLATLYSLSLIYKLFANTLTRHIIDAIQNEADITDLQQWLAGLNDRKKPILFALAYCVLITVYGIAFAATGAGLVGFGPVTFSLLGGFLAGIVIYYTLKLMTYPLRLSRYHYNLYPADPANSEVLDQLSDLFILILYIGASLVVVLSVMVVWLDLATLANIILVVVITWIPLITFFVVNQVALSRIITKAKWQTLNEIQAQIAQIKAEGDITGKETMDAVYRLMDYHDRIKATRNSALDLRAGLNFLNSLLLPIIAFVLDQLLSLFF